jgi:hypothetical protein
MRSSGLRRGVPCHLLDGKKREREEEEEEEEEKRDTLN